MIREDNRSKATIEHVCKIYGGFLSSMSDSRRDVDGAEREWKEARTENSEGDAK